MTLYSGWVYVLVEAGPLQAATWRHSDASTVCKSALPNLIFPADRSWLLSPLWDDAWSCIGGSSALIASLLDDLVLQSRARRVELGCDVTPPVRPRSERSRARTVPHPAPRRTERCIDVR